MSEREPPDRPHFPVPGTTGGYRELQPRAPHAVAEADVPVRRPVHVDPALLLEKQRGRRGWLRAVQERVAFERKRENARAISLFVVVILVAASAVGWCLQPPPYRR